MRVSRLLAANGLVDAYFFSEEARERGHIVHLAAEQVFTGRHVVVAPQYQGYADALREASLHLELVPVMVEHRLRSAADRLTGRPDLVGWLPHPKGRLQAGPVIADVKSGDPHPSHRIQLALYERLADAEGVRKMLPTHMQKQPWQRVGIYVRENGKHFAQLYLDPADRYAADVFVYATCWRMKEGLLADTPPGAEPDDASLPAGAWWQQDQREAR